MVYMLDIGDRVCVKGTPLAQPQNTLIEPDTPRALALRRAVHPNTNQLYMDTHSM
jgi:hypothetical protein